MPISRVHRQQLSHLLNSNISISIGYLLVRYLIYDCTVCKSYVTIIVYLLNVDIKLFLKFIVNSSQVRESTRFIPCKNNGLILTTSQSLT